MTKRHFTRGGRGVFTCSTCGRSTRQTTQPLDSSLCGDCDELAMTENSILDRAQTVDEIAKYRDEMVAHIVAKGGDKRKIRENFEILWTGR